MNFVETPLKGSYIIESNPFKDSRGLFARLYCKNSLSEICENPAIEQINYSLTVEKGSIRGLHFQYPPKSEVKMIRCLTGSVFDVIVDIRHDSPTFLNWYGETISADNMKMMYAPKGFAHGFQTLEENCTLLYLHSDSYAPSCEGALRYNDPAIGIKWPLTATHLSSKDENHPLITSAFQGLVL